MTKKNNMKPKRKIEGKSGAAVASSALVRPRGNCLAKLKYPTGATRLPSNNPDPDVHSPDVALKVHHEMPMTSMGRGKVGGRLDLRTAAKVMAVAMLVTVVVDVVEKPDVGLLVERDLNQILGAEVVPFVVHVVHTGVKGPNDPSSPATPGAAARTRKGTHETI